MAVTEPLIAAVEGYALAGGLELMIACDLVVAHKDAKFGIPEVKRGLVAAAGLSLFGGLGLGLVHGPWLQLSGRNCAKVLAAGKTAWVPGEWICRAGGDYYASK